MALSEKIGSNLSLVVFLTSLSLYVYVQLFYASRPEEAGGQLVRDDRKKVVLVTGGAGFIGFHLSLALVEQGHKVYVIDNFNDYYDVRLKIDRAYELHQLGIKVYNEDLCTEDFLEELFAEVPFTHVAHLAAQAGVRYSLQNPQAYIKANVACQMALLNVLKSYMSIHLVYASSSSVYGKENTIPFRLTDNTDKPGNMYAATKKTDELLAMHYCEKYNVVGVGLRFFTVYGPWGRPDMSVYLFAEAARKGKPIPMFFVSDDNPLGRDFTYVADIVQGVLASMDYRPARCGEKFNLGFGHPVSVPDMIKILIKEMKTNATVDKLPLPPTEILRTWADISASEKLLDFHPKTNLSIGVKRFVEWYIPYMAQRETEAKSKNPSRQEIWFGQLVEEQLQRQKRYNVHEEKREEERFIRSFQFEEGSCESRSMPVKTFKKHSNMKFNGYELITYSELAGNIEALKKHCQLVPSCAAFTSQGTLKSKVPPSSDWMKEQSCDTYVVNKDWCDFHICHEYAKCVADQQNSYKCECPPGTTGNGRHCVPTEWKPDLFFIELHNIFNATSMKAGKELVFFSGEDSPGGDVMYLEKYKNQKDNLQAECEKNPLCVGFSTNGYLKAKILPRDMWTKEESQEKATGLYVYNINYCLLNDIDCPEYAECVNLGPGNSQCRCPEEYLMVDNKCMKLFVDKVLVPSLATCTGKICETPASVGNV